MEKRKNIRIKDYPKLYQKTLSYKKKGSYKRSLRIKIYKKAFEDCYGKVDYCMKCGSKDRLQIHHIDKNNQNANPENLIKLCFKCHCQAYK